MKVLKHLLIYVWRLWFVVVAFIVTTVMFPFLMLSVSSSKFYNFFSVLARVWSFLILIFSGFVISTKGRENIDKSRQYIIISNHSSYLDIMMSYLCVPINFMFIGKASLAKLPIFGPIYKSSNILVDRSSAESRRQILHKTKNEVACGRSIFIYPEGTTKNHINRLMPFKDGAFALAIDCQIPILPVTFLDNVRKFPADYIAGSPGLLRAIIDSPIETKGMTMADRAALKQKVFDILDSQLAQHGYR